jgi:hypothetical protein
MATTLDFFLPLRAASSAAAWPDEFLLHRLLPPPRRSRRPTVAALLWTAEAEEIRCLDLTNSAASARLNVRQRGEMLHVVAVHV